MRISSMLVMMTFALSILRIQVSIPRSSSPHVFMAMILIQYVIGIKEVVTLTSDLSRKNLEKDFERMDTPQGTFYRVYFDIYLTLDGSEFNAELVCQGEVMGRCTSRFR
jgi:hypothetical protein